MKRSVLLLLVLSLGLNLGLLYKQFIAPGDGVSSRDRSAQEDQRRLDLPLDQIIAHRLERMTEHLNLDERQQQSTKEILQEFSPQILERRRELDQSRADLQGVFASPELDEERFRAVSQRLISLQADLDSLVAESLLREMVTLTPEQRAAYTEAFPRNRPRRGVRPQ